MNGMEYETINIEIVNIECKNVGELHQNLGKLKEKQLIITSVNAQSCANLESMDEIKFFLNKFKQNSDVVILSETWFKKEHCGLYDISDFTAIHDCRENQRGGGLSIYVNKKWKIRNHSTGVISSCNSVQLEITNADSSETLAVIGVYRPPTQNALAVRRFMESMENVLEWAATKRCYIGGDINIDADSTISVTRKYINLIESYGSRLCNMLPTKLGARTRIDHLLSNVTHERDHTVFTTSNNFSDHEALVMSVDGITSREGVKTLTGQNGIVCGMFQNWQPAIHGRSLCTRRIYVPLALVARRCGVSLTMSIVNSVVVLLCY